MDLDWSDADRRFRDEVWAFLDAELTPELRRVGSSLTSVYAEYEPAMAWQKILHVRGWAAPAWPVEYGGCGWSITQRYIFASELAAAHAPPLSPMGLGMCGPVLIGHGTPEQKAHFLPRMLAGDDFWCQGYSEPESGSDLASLQMSAQDDGDHLVCSGHKLWTTHAHRANWIFCLVRTAREAIPQKGITFLLIDMTTPGVEVTPIVSLSGEHIQNHVFFTDVRVPKANVVGRIGEGWGVAKYLMQFERGGGVNTPGQGAAAPDRGHDRGRADQASRSCRRGPGAAAACGGRGDPDRCDGGDGAEAAVAAVRRRRAGRGVLYPENRRHRAQPAPDRDRTGGRRPVRRSLPAAHGVARRSDAGVLGPQRSARRWGRPTPGRWPPSTSTTAPVPSMPAPTRSSATSWPRRSWASEVQALREPRVAGAVSSTDPGGGTRE